jgi:DNA-binding MarR family transcriptional regulator
VTRRPRIEFGDYLPYLINRVGWALALEFVQGPLARDRLNIAMWRALAVLSNGGAQRQIDVATKTSIDVSTLSRAATRLAKMGLVTRTRSAKSSREVIVRLTARGRAVLDRIIPAALAAERDSIKGLSARDLEVVRRCLHRMYENISTSSQKGAAVSRTPAKGARRRPRMGRRLNRSIGP